MAKAGFEDLIRDADREPLDLRTGGGEVLSSASHRAYGAERMVRGGQSR